MVSLLIAVIVTAIVFDYINGFHDAANAIATVVSTGVLPLRTAVIIAAMLQLRGRGDRHGRRQDHRLWLRRSGRSSPRPSSSPRSSAPASGTCSRGGAAFLRAPRTRSIGGLARRRRRARRRSAPSNGTRWSRRCSCPLVLSPTLGFVVAFLLTIAVLWIVRRIRPVAVHRRRRDACSCCRPAPWPSRMARTTRRSRWASSPSRSWPSSPRGTAGSRRGCCLQGRQVPLWVIVVCAGAIALRHDGRRQAASSRPWARRSSASRRCRASPRRRRAALTILGASHLGVPVSTTHCINACIMGVGASKRVSACAGASPAISSSPGCSRCRSAARWRSS